MSSATVAAAKVPTAAPAKIARYLTSLLTAAEGTSTFFNSLFV